MGVSVEVSREFEDAARAAGGRVEFDGVNWWLLGREDGAKLAGPCREFRELVRVVTEQLKGGERNASENDCDV